MTVNVLLAVNMLLTRGEQASGRWLLLFYDQSRDT